MQAIEFNSLEGLLRKMRQAFPQPEVQPGADRDKLMYKSGQHSVIKWVEVQIEQQQNANKQEDMGSLQSRRERNKNTRNRRSP